MLTTTPIYPTQRQYEIISYLTDVNYDYVDTVIVSTGRQVGKTFTCTLAAMKWALSNTEEIGFFLPTYKQCRKVFRNIEKMFGRIPGMRSNKSELAFDFGHNGSRLSFFTAENDNFRGETFTKLIVDEACFVKDEIWEVLKPTISVARSNGNGKILLTSTPKRKNWFYTEFNKKGPRRVSISFTTEEGGLVSPEVILEDKTTMNPERFKNEYLAEFMDSGNGVFEYKDCVKEVKYISGDTCTAAVDWGIEDDYTVLTVMDYKGNLVNIQRWKGADWMSVIKEIALTLKKYNNPLCYCETNGIGNMPTKELRKVYNSTRDWVTSHKSKTDAIMKLSHDFSASLISIPDDSDLLLELDAYEANYDASTGKVKYGARYGFHDDIVMSLAICNFNRVNARRRVSF